MRDGGWGNPLGEPALWGNPPPTRAIVGLSRGYCGLFERLLWGYCGAIVKVIKILRLT
uniref:Uncharacterized protein n=1 Tax=viral metagenome TaxID=1070528 RepID=A0A6C0LCX1_9ZZZZ